MIKRHKLKKDWSYIKWFLVILPVLIILSQLGRCVVPNHNRIVLLGPSQNFDHRACQINTADSVWFCSPQPQKRRYEWLQSNFDFLTDCSPSNWYNRIQLTLFLLHICWLSQCRWAYIERCICFRCQHGVYTVAFAHSFALSLSSPHPPPSLPHSSLPPVHRGNLQRMSAKIKYQMSLYKILRM